WRHGARHILGGGARIDGRDEDGRWRDRRIPVDRQVLERHQSEQRDGNGDHARHNRPLDEVVLDVAVGAAGAVRGHWPTGAATTGLALPPGRTFCTPSTMTRSPATRPESISQRSPTQAVATTSLLCTVSPGPMTKTD